MSTQGNTNGFTLTRWTLVERTRGTSPEARAALSELCGTYYAPVVAFLRRETSGEEAARDLAHAFFARLLEGGALAAADPQLGRFRSYLLGAVKHFLLNVRRDAARDKRGGGRADVSLQTETGTSPGLEIADRRPLPSDAIFDREWAMVIVERALATLQLEYDSAGKAAQFAALKPWLSVAGASHSETQTAERLGASEGAMKVAIHRLRKRFRELVRQEISHTLNNPADLEEEMRHLIDALAAR